MTGEFYTNEKLFFPGVRPVTRNLLEAVFYDAPLTSATMKDFGIESPDHFHALRYAIEVTDVHPMEIDAMASDGAKLTAWLNDTGYNRKNVVFHTTRDRVEGFDGSEYQRVEPSVADKPLRRQKHHQQDQER